MNSPLVSIIIPTYNYGHFITDALLSVSAQSYRNWECIIVDDGSTDNTSSIVHDYIKMHPQQRFQYIFIQNSGLSNARNVGIAKSQGNYLQFLDADDLLLKDKLTVQIKLLQSKHCALVFSKSLFFNDLGTKKIYKEKFPAGFLATETLVGQTLIWRLMKNNIFTVSSALVHKDLMLKAGLFDVRANANEDWLMWFKIALLLPNFIFDATDNTATEIRMHQNGIMSGKQKMFESEVFVRAQMNDSLKDQFEKSDIIAFKKYNADLLALHQIRSLDLKDGISYVFKVLAKAPTRNFRLLGLACVKLIGRILKR